MWGSILVWLYFQQIFLQLLVQSKIEKMQQLLYEESALTQRHPDTFPWRPITINEPLWAHGPPKSSLTLGFTLISHFTNLDRWLMTRIHIKCTRQSGLMTLNTVTTLPCELHISVYHVCAYCLWDQKRVWDPLELPSEGSEAPCDGTNLKSSAGAVVSTLTRWAISAACHLSFTCSPGTHRTQELSPLPLSHTARF